MVDAGSDSRTPVQQYLARLRQLEDEQKIWLDSWKALADQAAPGTVRENPADRKRAADNPSDVVNGTPGLTIRVSSAGLMTGLSNPADKWFKLTLADQDLADWSPASEWLNHFEQALYMLFAKSNVYRSLHTVYRHMPWGVGCMLTEEDPVDILCSYVWPLGSYYVANGPKGKVDTLYRKYSITVGNMARMFGLSALSTQARNLYDRGQYEQHIEVVRGIEPNEYPDPEKLDWGGMPVRSVWFERGSDKQKLLRRKGYHEFPAAVPRWEPTGEDSYGRGFGLQMLPDCRQLQLAERRKLQILDKLTTPTTVAPTSLENTRSAQRAGDTIYTDDPEKVHTLYEPPPAGMVAVVQEIRVLESRIKQIGYYDLWLALTGDDRRQPKTATEVAEIHAEKLVQLGPAVQGLQGELLDPLINRAASILIRRCMPYWVRGEDAPLLPRPPDELLHGADLRVEYISPLTQAQRMVGISGMERLAAVTGNISAKVPDVTDNVDFDKWVQKYAKSLGVDPELIRDSETVAKLRSSRAQQAAAAQQPQASLASAKAAQVLSQTDTRQPSALSDIASAFGAQPGGLA